METPTTPILVPVPSVSVVQAAAPPSVPTTLSPTNQQPHARPRIYSLSDDEDLLSEEEASDDLDDEDDDDSNEDGEYAENVAVYGKSKSKSVPTRSTVSRGKFDVDDVDFEDEDDNLFQAMAHAGSNSTSRSYLNKPPQTKGAKRRASSYTNDGGGGGGHSSSPIGHMGPTHGTLSSVPVEALKKRRSSKKRKKKKGSGSGLASGANVNGGGGGGGCNSDDELIKVSGDG